MRAHEAGALHGDSAIGVPPGCVPPKTSTRWYPQLWPRSVTRDEQSGALTVGGLERRTDPRRVRHARVRARRRRPARPVPRLRRRRSPGTTSTTPARPSSARPSCGSIDEEGLFLDVCTGGELATALSRRHAAGADRLPRQQQVGRASWSVRSTPASAGSSSTRSTRSTGSPRSPASATSGNVLVRVTVGVEAHTHEFIATAHEDQKFGFSLAGGAAFEAVVQDPRRRRARPARPALAHRLADLRRQRVRGRRPAGAGAAGADPRRARRRAARAGPRWRVRHRVHDPGRPVRAGRPGQADDQDRRRRVRGARAWPCRSCRSSPAGPSSGPAMFTLYEVGTVKDVDGLRTYVSVDGGMSDNIRTALYDASYSATLAGRRVDARTPILARVVGKHCESGDIVVKDEFLPADVQPGDLLAVPGTGAYCRSMASNYNHVPRPPVVAVRDGAVTGDRPAGDRRRPAWHWMWDEKPSCAWRCSAAGPSAPRSCGCCTSRPPT